jgi:Cu/Ag efflux protein CusF
MKRPSIILVAIIFVLSTTGVVLAQEKGKAGKASEVTKPGESVRSSESAKPQASQSPEAKPKKAKKEAPAKPAEYRMGGVITAIDVAAKKITIKQDQVRRERTVRLRIGNKASNEISNVQVGDAVNVWIRGNVITTLMKVS